MTSQALKDRVKVALEIHDDDTLSDEQYLQRAADEANMPVYKLLEVMTSNPDFFGLKESQ